MTGDVWPVPNAASSRDIAAEFEAFVRTETAGLLRTAHLLTGERGAAEDLVQETLLRLYRRWSRVKAADNPMAYVRRTLLNTFLNSRRSASSREVVAQSGSIPLRTTTSDIATDLANRDEVWQLLRSLPARQRAALVLRYYLDLPDREAASELGCRPGTLRSLISRSLVTLRTRASDSSRSSRPEEGGGHAE